MTWKVILRAGFILACINCIDAQYFDFLQALQPYLQTPPPQQFIIYSDFTTRRPRPKQKPSNTDTRNEGNIRKIVSSVEQTDKRRKQTTAVPNYEANYFSTTQKPVRKATKATVAPNNNQHGQNRGDTKPTNSRVTSTVSGPKATNDFGNHKDSSSVIYFEDQQTRPNSRGSSNSGGIGSASKETDKLVARPITGLRDTVVSNNKPKTTTTTSRPITKKSHNQPLVAANYESGSNFYENGRNTVNYYTTKPPFYETTKYYQQGNRGNKNYYTTHNPLINRPGVKPPVVNGPPITNKPVTQRPDFSHAATLSDDNVSPEIITGPDEDYMSAVEKKRYIDIAERMCEKYKSLNIKQLEAIPLVPSPHPVRVNVSSCPPTTVPLVIGGKVVTIQEFPHMALLGWRKVKNKGYSWKCGGSLLSNQYVLTAGHCAYQDRDDNIIAGPPRKVQLGSSFLNDPKATIVKISAVIRHPKYKQPKAYYDLAIIKMASTVSFSESIKPACLGVPPQANRPIIATGWGKTEYGGPQSRELRSVSIPVWDINECYNALGVSMKIPNGPSSDSQICAGEKSGGKDTCQGDSGGPAQIQDGCTWRVVAVTSVGRSCGAAETPAIYATVQRPFISAVIFGNQVTQNSDNRNRDQTTNSNGNDGNNRNNQQPTNTNNRNDNYNNNYNRDQTTNSNRNDGNNRYDNYNNNYNRDQTTNSNRNDGNNRYDNYNNNYNRDQTTNSNGNDGNNRNNQRPTNPNNRNDNYNNNYNRDQTTNLSNDAYNNNRNIQQTSNNNNRKDNSYNNNRDQTTNNNRNQQGVINESNNNNRDNRHTTNNDRRNDNWSNSNQQIYPVSDQNNNYNQQSNNWNIQTSYSNSGWSAPNENYNSGQGNSNNWNNYRPDQNYNNYNQQNNQPSRNEYSNYNVYNPQTTEAYISSDYYNTPQKDNYNNYGANNNYNYNRENYGANTRETYYNGDENVWWT